MQATSLIQLEEITKLDSKNIDLIGHVIASYPNKQDCLQIASGILKAGATHLEVQFPFVDGSADGPIIQDASNKSVENGFKVEEGFEIIESLAKNYPDKKIIAMLYANIIYSYGLEEFLKRLYKANCYGVIIPDFTFKQEDFNLRKLCKKYKIHFIELVAQSTSKKRLKQISRSSSPFIYAIARAGITGAKTNIDKNIISYIKTLKKHIKKPIFLGFGICEFSQIQALRNLVEGVVVGSYFVLCVNKFILESKDSTKNTASKKDIKESIKESSSIIESKAKIRQLAKLKKEASYNIQKDNLQIKQSLQEDLKDYICEVKDLQTHMYLSAKSLFGL